MIEIGRYLYSVIIASLFVSILMAITPGTKAVKGVIKLSTGIFLVIVVVSPFTQNRLSDLIGYVEDIKIDASGIITQAEIYTDTEIAKVIKQQTESYVLDKASDFGAEISVELALNGDTYFPETITIRGSVSPVAKQQLSKLIADELGISEEMQTWVVV